MALPTYSTMKHHLLPAATYSRLVPRATYHDTATIDEPTIKPQNRSRSAVNIPASLSNLLHLNLNHHTNPTGTHAGSSNNAMLDVQNFNRQTPTYSPTEDISSMYSEIHGAADWSRLLSPLHPWLRREILKYGEFAQATYDAFDSNPFSQYGGSCMYGRHRLFEKLGLLRHGYDVTKYLYAMSHVDLPRWLERSLHAEAWSRDSNWMGYVAVSGDEESRRIGCRDIVVSWRGTVVPAEWLEDIQGKLESIESNDQSDIRVEHGFRSIYTSKAETTRYNKLSASEQVMGEIKRLVKFYQEKGEKVSITITGHSLGGALALLNAYEAASALPSVPVRVISFGAPRVGNEAFADRLKELGVKVLRMVVKQDVVPKMPGILFNEGMKMVEKVTGTLDWVYTHVGVELGLNVKTSPYLKNCIDFAGFHNLEIYLHLVDGYVSSKSGFRCEAKRDVALINKASGMLREEIGIPPCWHQPANRGLVCNPYGRWTMPNRELEDIPSPYREGYEQLLN
ncbi:Alpha/beta-Hydrolases superfamily protein [Rhynchospora pubera]|uniref:Alpha/beta-Hydrolases superfamily protein n=1 Tax=Rhynchospora pubera TaxID=906938 RepID=A0AAV8G9J5_9POAL|nr:Alpha/beta-Hydrolases superfamily protein [Rhynchospora pubera]